MDDGGVHKGGEEKKKKRGDERPVGVGRYLGTLGKYCV